MVKFSKPKTVFHLWFSY
uniref:Uncharacterized protein n=1 Tax=Anguilla anguilla TaxID=7936 RepID=A0A0E9U280_ANGAN